MNKLLASGGIATLIIGLVLLVLPVSHIPLLDANRQVLVESERGGYCAGEVLIKTSGRGSEEGMAECRETSTIDDSINHRVVQAAFCRGIVANYPWSQEECMTEIEGSEIWPTARGTWTNSWNRRFPYPGGIFARPQGSASDESRTGDRLTNDREESDR